MARRQTGDGLSHQRLKTVPVTGSSGPSAARRPGRGRARLVSIGKKSGQEGSKGLRRASRPLSEPFDCGIDGKPLEDRRGLPRRCMDKTPLASSKKGTSQSFIDILFHAQITPQQRQNTLEVTTNETLESRGLRRFPVGPWGRPVVASGG